MDIVFENQQSSEIVLPIAQGVKGDKGEQGLQGAQGSGVKITPWTAGAFLLGDQVNYLGKDWVSNAATVAGDVPGTSTKWVERLSGYAVVDTAMGFTNFSEYEFGVMAAAATEKYKIQGNFSCIKRFNAHTSAVNSYIFSLKNSSGDEISIYNSGYTFTIYIKKAGVVIKNYTEASSILFPNLIDIMLFIQVDYDQNKIIFSRSGSTVTYTVTELAQIKDVLFTINSIAVNSYSRSCKFNILLSGLFSFDNANYLFGSTGNYDFINSDFATPNINTSILTGVPTTFWPNNTKTFSSGKVTYTSAECGSQSVGNNNYFCHIVDINTSLLSLKNTNAIATYSIDVVGTLSVSNTTTQSWYLLRLIEKNTGQVIDYVNYGFSQTITIPAGSWKISITFSVKYISYGASAYVYFLGFRGLSAGGSFTVYNDISIVNCGVALSAFPTLAGMKSVYCPFTKQYLNGTFGLSNTYKLT